MNAIFLRSGSAHVDNVITKRCSKQLYGCSCQDCKATNHTVTLRNLPNTVSGTYSSARRNLPPEPTPAHAGTLRNLPEPATFRNLPPEPTPATCRNSAEPSGTYLRNLPPEPTSGTYTSTHRNSPEPPAHTGTGTCLRNLHQHTPELSGTFRNLPPEPAPATRTGTHRYLSGLKTPLTYVVREKNKLW